MTPRYRGSKISGCQQLFLTEKAICIVRRWKKIMGYLFAPECNHVEESHSGQRFVKIRQRDVTTSPLYNQLCPSNKSLSYGYVLRNPIALSSG